MVERSPPPGSGLLNLNTTFTANDPQLLVTIDRQKPRRSAYPLADHARPSHLYGSSYINDFDFNNRSYSRLFQADAQFRRNASDLRPYYVRLRLQPDDPARQPRPNQRGLRPQVINHYNSSLRRSTARPRKAKLRAGPCGTWRSS